MHADLTPDRKPSAGALAGSLTAVGLWVAEVAWAVEVPAPIAAQIAVIVGFAVSYFVPER